MFCDQYFIIETVIIIYAYYRYRMSLIQNESDTEWNIQIGNATLLQTGAETLWFTSDTDWIQTVSVWYQTDTEKSLHSDTCHCPSEQIQICTRIPIQICSIPVQICTSSDSICEIWLCIFYVYTCHILDTTGSFGCASSVAVSEVWQGQQQVLKEKQITTVTARSEMSFATDGFWGLTQQRMM